MELKLAKKDINDKQKTISLEEMQSIVESRGNATFYLDKDNSIKDIQKMRSSLEKNAKVVHWNEIRYGQDGFLYELHIIDYSL